MRVKVRIESAGGLSLLPTWGGRTVWGSVGFKRESREVYASVRADVQSCIRFASGVDIMYTHGL